MKLSELKNRPLVIAGPCSAESEEQILRIAKDLNQSATTILRAGIWKPRTRPGYFEGVGEVGLKWMERARLETGLKIATEVATPEHVELALAYDVDVLWIGARTTVSPFAVQEIAEALKGTNKTVMVKNPINPDLLLWLGAIDRLEAAGITDLAAIHRGFSFYGKSPYRNVPQWQIPIDFKMERPNIPMIVDPSHITGNRKLVAEVTQTAMNYGYDGMMVEVHNNPDKALSDGPQQITPLQLIEMLEHLTFRKEDAQDAAFNRELRSLRDRIDVADEQIIGWLWQRMEAAEKIGYLKANANVQVLQKGRWIEVIKHITSEAEKHQMDPYFVERIFNLIHLESLKLQGNK